MSVKKHPDIKIEIITSSIIDHNIIVPRYKGPIVFKYKYHTNILKNENFKMVVVVIIIIIIIIIKILKSK